VSEKLIRLPKVKEMVGLGTTAIYDKMKKGEFPKQVKLGRLSGWVESEVQAWITKQIQASRPEAANDSPHAQAA
jgi:prophage regulatory protein